MIVQCSWCRRLKIGFEWVTAPLASGAKVSHGICGSCRDQHFPKLAQVSA